MKIFKPKLNSFLSTVKGFSITVFERELQKMDIISLERRQVFYRTIVRAYKNDSLPSKYTIYCWKSKMVDFELNVRRQKMINLLTKE